MMTAPHITEPAKTTAQPSHTAAAAGPKKRAGEVEERETEGFGQLMNQMMVNQPHVERKSAEAAETGETGETGQTKQKSATGSDAVAELPQIQTSVDPVSQEDVFAKLLGVTDEAGAPEQGASKPQQTAVIALDTLGAEELKEPALPDGAATDQGANPQKKDSADHAVVPAALSGKAMADEAADKVLNELSRNKEKGKEPGAAGQNPAPAGKTEFSALLRAEGSVAQHHAVQAAAPELTHETRASGLVSRAQAADPAELFTNTVAIMKGSSRLAVTLEPEGLGKLNINLSLDKGLVNAHINVSDDAARNLISNNMQQILHSLAKDGISVGGFSVSLRGGNGGGENSETGAFFPNMEPGRGGAEEISGKPELMSAGIVSIFV